MLKLNEITEFNQALIYGFEPAASWKFTDSNTVEYLLHAVSQYQDMFDAYLYAQKEILTTIKKIGVTNITPQMILDWINQIHLRIAATLARDNKVNSGSFTQIQVMRWLYGANMKDYLNCFLSELSGYDYGTTLKLLVKECGLELKLAMNLLGLLTRIQAKKNDIIPRDQIPGINWKSRTVKGTLTLLKLATLYHTHQLNSEEEKLINKIVKICLPPSEYPQKMWHFANEFLTAWKACDPNNIEQVASLASLAYYNITEIHAYFDGNGRTATCFMNTVLRALDWPSILMRYPCERNDPNSSYYQAIEKINTNQELLFKHIKNRIEETKGKGEYSNQELAELIKLRLQFGEIILLIKDKFPKYKINDLYLDLVKKIEAKWEKKLQGDMDKKDQGLGNLFIKSSLRFYIDSFTKEFENLQEQTTSTDRITASSVIQREYRQEEKQKIIEKLEELTGKSCKSNSINGFLLLDLQEKESVHLFEALQATQALRVQVRGDTQTQKALCIDQVNFEKLLAIESLANYSKMVETTPNSLAKI